MRLLEFNLDASGANPQSKTTDQSPVQKLPRPVKLDKLSGNTDKIFPLNSGETIAKARKPIDLEQLQQRVKVLERRILARAGEDSAHPTSQDLDLLKQRVMRLQQSVHAELWAARQREHTMLQMLSKPSLLVATKLRFEHFGKQQLPAAGRCLAVASQQWWQNSQPGWWPALWQTWQYSLSKARGLNRN